MIYKASVPLSKTKKQYKFQALLQGRCQCYSDFRALVRPFPDTSKSAPCFLLNDEKTTLVLTSRRCNVSTLRRHDVETSRRCRLLTCIVVDPMSRRWDVTMCQPSLCTASCCSNIASPSCLFAPIAPACTPLINLGIQPQKLRINIKKSVKTKDRRGYNLSVLGTHHNER